MRTLSPVMAGVFEQLRLVAATDSTVLLTGESGTGKGVMARLIHALSPRKNRPFASVHCGAIPESLIESELFGHEKGAFTGAVSRKKGRFELALGGTIFLDEIGTITAGTQIKLLQVLQDRTFQPVGAETVVETNARILAATNNDLEMMCAEGLFRQDLYYRLKVFPIKAPPLRDRKEDIPQLVKVFLKRLNRHYGKAVTALEPGVLKALTAYDWPGNIRELENLMERAYILEKGPELSRGSFPGEFFSKNSKTETASRLEDLPTLMQMRAEVLARAEKQYLIQVLNANKGRIDKSAATAGIGTRQLHKLMTKYNLRKEEFKKK
jgi:transcriptional regulator with GAF, ATPase, and Fis domain